MFFVHFTDLNFKILRTFFKEKLHLKRINGVRILEYFPRLHHSRRKNSEIKSNLQAAIITAITMKEFLNRLARFRIVLILECCMFI